MEQRHVRQYKRRQEVSLQQQHICTKQEVFLAVLVGYLSAGSIFAQNMRFFSSPSRLSISMRRMPWGVAALVIMHKGKYAKELDERGLKYKNVLYALTTTTVSYRYLRDFIYQSSNVPL